MPLLMARIDDRLIHGQVVVGCCSALRAQRVILCDEGVAADTFQRRLYATAVPPEIEVEFLGVEATAARLAELGEDARATTIVVTADCETMAALCAASSAIESVCIGGMHHHESAVEFWPGVFVTAEETQCLRGILERGVQLRVQSVPSAPSVDAAEKLRAGDAP